MDKKEYLDRDGLKEYDELLKSYVVEEIESETRRNMTIVEFVPEDENVDE